MRALDRALDIPAARIEQRVARMRRKYPWATTPDLCAIAGSRLRRDAGLSSGAVGACAALPALGTGLAFTLTVGQSAAFLTSAVTYVLTVAELQQVHLVDVDRRRTLVLSALLGREGSEIVSGSLGLSTLFWAAQSLAGLPLPTVKSINARLARQMAKRTAAKSGALAIGRLVPFGIGAALGWSGGRSLASQVIEGTQAALGPAVDAGEAEAAQANQADKVSTARPVGAWDETEAHS
ncbi:hypothetical protein SAMN04487766_11013 [Actinomyces ruminicola]|uniref:EcsC protein family protein n=1 Tax=Actinomyces ruminicola TaxID=332524 RepID=A0A1G9XPF7_9ACTO|nr:hypothetical protein SAMN04487766_11013 [Actinomyces ruminicola]